MPRLRRSKLLSCFYCGRQSSLTNDGLRRKFLCLYCDATNHLDENGEITDPPVATERELPAPQYTINRPSSPPVTNSSDSIFCATCLKNQRLFTASLAQYLPDDPSDPSYDELERGYYTFRRSLEKRYPQVCRDCEAKVESRIRAAGYTAKTDHLRKMMARSRARPVGRRVTMLDWAARLGQWLWWGGLALQMLWHVKMTLTILATELKNETGMVDPDVAEAAARNRKMLMYLSSWLPGASFLIQSSIVAAIASAWWNPRFVQVSRGFSRHLLGFRQWYSFQGLIIFFRIIARRLGEPITGSTESVAVYLLPHALLAVLMIMFYSFAAKSIKVDTTPLFGTTNITASPSQTPPRQKPKKEQRKEDQQSLASILDEVLETPARQTSARSIRQLDLSPLPSSRSSAVSFRPNDPFSSDPGFSPASTTFGTPQRSIFGQEDPDAMDWTPTQSQHRAFSNAPLNSSPTRPFSQAPIEPNNGSFWYKVPPAPINPAQKLRNPPITPIIRSQPSPANPIPLTFSQKKSESSRGQAATTRKSGVEFKQPQFFAPVKDDEGTVLADLLSSSFSLGNDTEDQPEDGPQASKTTSLAQKPRQTLLTDPSLYSAFLLLWLMLASFPIPYTKESQLAVLAIVGCLTVGSMGETSAPLSSGKYPIIVAILLGILEVGELSALCWTGAEVWSGSGSSGSGPLADVASQVGVGVIGVGLVKRMLIQRML